MQSGRGGGVAVTGATEERGPGGIGFPGRAQVALSDQGEACPVARQGALEAGVQPGSHERGLPSTFRQMTRASM